MYHIFCLLFGILFGTSIFLEFELELHQKLKTALANFLHNSFGKKKMT